MTEKTRERGDVAEDVKEQDTGSGGARDPYSWESATPQIEEFERGWMDGIHGRSADPRPEGRPMPVCLTAYGRGIVAGMALAFVCEKVDWPIEWITQWMGRAQRLDAMLRARVEG